MHEGVDPPLARGWLALLSLLLVVIVLVPNLFGSYGIFIDEFYYVACSKHLAAGYVDHPPLAPWLLALSRALLGESQLALRVVPALAGAATVFLTGMMAWRMGGGSGGQLLASSAVLTAPIPMLMFGFYSVNALEILLWTAAAYALVEQAHAKANPRWWIMLGVVAGLALLAKHTFVLFSFGLALGLLATPARRLLVDRHFWAAVGLATLIFLPNLVWQFQHDWVSLDFYRGAEAKNVHTPASEVLVQQLLFMNPVAALLWVAGIVFLLRGEPGRAWRHLGWTFVVLLALAVVSQRSRPDRIAGIYPLVFAAGGVWWERRAKAHARWALTVLGALMAAVALPLAPTVLPIMEPEKLGPYAEFLGVVPKIEADHEAALPQWLDDRLDWPAFVDEVALVASDSLSEGERPHAVILTPNYGRAGALEHLGADRDLPTVVSPHNSYFTWGPGTDAPSVVIAVGFGSETLSGFFEEVELVHASDPAHNGRRDGSIYVCRGPKVSFDVAFAKLKRFG